MISQRMWTTLLILLISISFSIDLTSVYNTKQTCLSAFNTYLTIHANYSAYLDDCYSKYNSGQTTCDEKEWNDKYNVLLSYANKVKTACNNWAKEIKSKENEINQGYNKYCDKKGYEDECNYYDSLSNEIADIENDAWSHEIYDTDGDGMPDMLNWGDTDYSKCGRYMEPCDYMFTNTKFEIISPKTTEIKRMENGDVSLDVEVSVSEKPSEIYATFTQKKKGKYKGIIYSTQLQKEGKNYWAQIYLHKNEIYNGPARLDVSVDFGHGEQKKTVFLTILDYKETTNISNNTTNTSISNTNSSTNTGNSSNTNLDDYVKQIFKGVRANAVNSESIKTEKDIQQIASIKGFKITIIETPYGEVKILETNTNKKGMLGYQEKKKIVKVSSSFFEKVLEKIKEKLGLSFGDKAAKYFINKEIENIIYNEDDKIKKTEEDLGVDKDRAKLFNDVIDTNSRDVYNVVKEEIPDNEVSKRVKEALTELEKFHDRAAASGLKFEYTTVEQTVKGYVKGMSYDEVKKKRDVLRNIAAQNVEDYTGSVYRNGNGLVSNSRFLGVLAKEGKYNFKDPKDRAKYYFDLLWESGKIREWAKGE